MTLAVALVAQVLHADTGTNTSSAATRSDPFVGDYLLERCGESAEVATGDPCWDRYILTIEKRGSTYFVNGVEARAEGHWLRSGTGKNDIFYDVPQGRIHYRGSVYTDKPPRPPNPMDRCRQSLEYLPDRLAKADPDRGKKAYKTCRTCHNVGIDQAVSRIGPDLSGIAGARAGAVQDFDYSQVMAESGLVWTDENLDLFLCNPRGFIRGNRMGFAGVANPQKRADIILYVKSQSASP